MKSILLVCILFVALRSITAKTSVGNFKDTKDYLNMFKPVEGIVSCKCHGVEIERRFSMEKALEDVIEETKEEATIKDCEICSIDQLNCDFSINYLKPCKKIPVAKFTRPAPLDEFIKTQIDTNVAMNRSRRDIEGVGGCNFPRNLKTSHLSCTEYHKRITCTQRCIFGHTLGDSITREIKCDFSENVWKPVGFQECNPFIDCSMTLVATGNKSCLVGTTYHPYVCNVTCGDYEDKVATPLASFECQLSGGWNKPLPHCVIAGSGFALVPPPKVKSHVPEKEEENTMAKLNKMDKPPKMGKIQKMAKPQKINKPQKTDKPIMHTKPQSTDKPLMHIKPEKTDNPLMHIKPQKTDKPLMHIKPQKTDKPLMHIKTQMTPFEDAPQPKH